MVIIPQSLKQIWITIPTSELKRECEEPSAYTLMSGCCGGWDSNPQRAGTGSFSGLYDDLLLVSQIYSHFLAYP